MQRKNRSDAISHIGLEYYLDQPYSIARHNGNGYAEFVRAVDLPQPLKVNKTRLAALFNVTVPTIDKWLVLWKQEKRGKK